MGRKKKEAAVKKPELTKRKAAAIAEAIAITESADCVPVITIKPKGCQLLINAIVSSLSPKNGIDSIAARAGCSTAMLLYFLAGRHESLTIDQLKLLCDVLRIRPSSVFSIGIK